MQRGVMSQVVLNFPACPANLYRSLEKFVAWMVGKEGGGGGERRSRRKRHSKRMALELD